MFWTIFFENDPLNEPKKDATKQKSKKFYLFRKLVKNAKWWLKSNLPLSHSSDCKIVPVKRVLKNAESTLLPFINLYFVRRGLQILRYNSSEVTLNSQKMCQANRLIPLLSGCKLNTNQGGVLQQILHKIRNLYILWGVLKKGVKNESPGEPKSGYMFGI